MMPCHTARNVTAPMILHLAPISDTTATGILARKTAGGGHNRKWPPHSMARALPHLFRHREKGPWADLGRGRATPADPIGSLCGEREEQLSSEFCNSIS
jgi:hypothetical protein